MLLDRSANESIQIQGPFSYQFFKHEKSYLVKYRSVKAAITLNMKKKIRITGNVTMDPNDSRIIWNCNNAYT